MLLLAVLHSVQSLHARTHARTANTRHVQPRNDLTSSVTFSQRCLSTYLTFITLITKYNNSHLTQTDPRDTDRVGLLMMANRPITAQTPSVRPVDHKIKPVELEHYSNIRSLEVRPVSFADGRIDAASRRQSTTALYIETDADCDQQTSRPHLAAASSAVNNRPTRSLVYGTQQR